MARQPTDAELDTEVEFFEPHSGRPFDGAAVGLPVKVKMAIDWLDGSRLTLRQAMAVIQTMTSGKVEADPDHGHIMLWLGDQSWPQKAPLHGFQLIKFR